MDQNGWLRVDMLHRVYTARLSVQSRIVQEADCSVSHMALAAWALEAVSFGHS